MERFACNKCGSIDVFSKAKNESQTGLYCNDCGAWIKWLGKNEKNLIEHQEAVKKPIPLKIEDCYFSKEELRTIYRVLKIAKRDCQASERPSKAQNLDANEYQEIMNKIENMF